MSATTFSNVLRQLLFKRDKSAHDLAKETGLAPSSIYRILNGEAKTIRISTRFLLARALGVQPEAFDHEDVLSCDLPPMPPTPLSDSVADAPAKDEPLPVSGRVPLYRLSQVGAMARGDDEAPQRAVPPPPFDDYKGLDLIAVEVPPGRQGTDEPAPGDVLYVRPWKAEETPDPMDQDMVLAVRETGGALFTRWGLTPPEGVRPYGRVVCFARSWI